MQDLPVIDIQKLNTIIIDMAMNLEDSEVQELGCSAIYWIAKKNEESSAFLGKRGACEAIVAAMLGHPSLVGVVWYGLRAVFFFSDSRPAHQEAIEDNNATRLLEAGVLEAMTLAIQTLNDNMDVLKATCNAVHALTKHGKSAATKVVRAQLHKPILTAITELTHIAVAVESLCETLVHIAERTDDADWTTVSEDGANAVVVEALLVQIGIPATVIAACHAIAHFPNRPKCIISLWDASPVAAVVNAMKAHSNNTDVIVAGCRAVRFLSDNHHTVRSSGAPQAVLKALQSYTANVAVAKNGCLALGIIARTDARIITELKRSGVDAIIMSVMRLHAGNAEVMSAAKGVLKYTVPNLLEQQHVQQQQERQRIQQRQEQQRIQQQQEQQRMQQQQEQLRQQREHYEQRQEQRGQDLCCAGTLCDGTYSCTVM